MSKNTTQIKAAVVREKGGPFKVETLTLEAPRRDEVLVKVVATGLCHTGLPGTASNRAWPRRCRTRGERGGGCCQSRAWRFCGAHVLDMRTL
jgi:aryl-alcohol dehydrogenase